MKNRDELRQKLAKYKGMLLSAKEDDEKAFAKTRINQVQAELDSLNDSEETETKAKAKKEAKTKALSECAIIIPKLEAIIRDIKGQKEQHRASQAPVVKKKVSTILSEGIAKTVKRAVSKELTRDKVAKIDLDELKESKKSFEEGLKHLRNALGGISSSNDSFIKKFGSDMAELIKEVDEKQKQAKQAA